jgi:hypothetical protein
MSFGLLVYDGQTSDVQLTYYKIVIPMVINSWILMDYGPFYTVYTTGNETSTQQ